MPMPTSFLRRTVYGLGLIACVAFAGCSDETTALRAPAAGPVRLALAVQVASAGKTLRVVISYQRAGSNAGIPLLDQLIDVGVQARAVPLVVDIAPCLGDPQREATSADVGDRACVLHIAISLLGEAGEQLDQAVLPALVVRPGDVATASLAVGSRASYVALAPGLDHTCRALMVAGGGVRCWGSNRLNQLGKAPMPDFVQLSSGLSFMCGLTGAGEAWCWGDNGAGELGDNLASRSTATLVSSPVTFVQVVTGADFACGLAESGAAYCWGENAWGSLGDGTKARHALPAPVKGGLKFIRLGAGGHAACGLTDGTVYCWGALGTAVPSDAQTSLGPVTLAGTNVVGLRSFALGTNHACGLTVDGTAVCYGSNGNGQLGDGTSTDRTLSPVQVQGGLHFNSLTAGNGFSCGLATDGFAYCWGANQSGQLGVGANGNRATPTRVSGGIVFATLVAGQSHVCGSVSSGAMYCWGLNQSGQLGDGTTTNRSVPTLVK